MTYIHQVGLSGVVSMAKFTHKTCLRLVFIRNPFDIQTLQIIDFDIVRLFTILCFLFSVFNSLFSIFYSRFSIFYFLFSIHHSPLTIHPSLPSNIIKLTMPVYSSARWFVIEGRLKCFCYTKLSDAIFHIVE